MSLLFHFLVRQIGYTSKTDISSLYQICIHHFQVFNTPYLDLPRRLPESHLNWPDLICYHQFMTRKTSITTTTNCSCTAGSFQFSSRFLWFHSTVLRFHSTVRSPFGGSSISVIYIIHPWYLLHVNLVSASIFGVHIFHQFIGNWPSSPLLHSNILKVVKVLESLFMFFFFFLCVCLNIGATPLLSNLLLGGGGTAGSFQSSCNFPWFLIQWSLPKLVQLICMFHFENFLGFSSTRFSGFNKLLHRLPPLHWAYTTKGPRGYIPVYFLHFDRFEFFAFFSKVNFYSIPPLSIILCSVPAIVSITLSEHLKLSRPACSHPSILHPETKAKSIRKICKR